MCTMFRNMVYGGELGDECIGAAIGLPQNVAMQAQAMIIKNPQAAKSLLETALTKTPAEFQNAVKSMVAYPKDVNGDYTPEAYHMAYGAYGGARTVKHNGKSYKVRTGSRGGKYILVGKDKTKVYV